jgi:hypothetical protein
VLTSGGEERERPESPEDGGGVDDRRLGPAARLAQVMQGGGG